MKYVSSYHSKSPFRKAYARAHLLYIMVTSCSQLLSNNKPGFSRVLRRSSDPAFLRCGRGGDSAIQRSHHLVITWRVYGAHGTHGGNRAHGNRGARGVHGACDVCSNVVVPMVEVVTAWPVALVLHAPHELTAVIYPLGSNFSFNL